MALPLAAAALAMLLVWGPAPAGAQQQAQFANGTYRGTTAQEAVNVDHRRLEFRIRGGRVRLITEPTVRHGLCLSLPTFTIDGVIPVKRLSRRGGFTFTRPFLGTKIDRITGRFVDRKKIQGRAIYNFDNSDLCRRGVAKVRFTVTSGKKKKKKD